MGTIEEKMNEAVQGPDTSQQVLERAFLLGTMSDPDFEAWLLIPDRFGLSTAALVAWLRDRGNVWYRQDPRFAALDEPLTKAPES